MITRLLQYCHQTDSAFTCSLAGRVASNPTKLQLKQLRRVIGYRVLLHREVRVLECKARLFTQVLALLIACMANLSEYSFSLLRSGHKPSMVSVWTKDSLDLVVRFITDVRRTTPRARLNAPTTPPLSSLFMTTSFVCVNFVRASTSYSAGGHSKPLLDTFPQPTDIRSRASLSKTLRRHLHPHPPLHTYSRASIPNTNTSDQLSLLNHTHPHPMGTRARASTSSNTPGGHLQSLLDTFSSSTGTRARASTSNTPGGRL